MKPRAYTFLISLPALRHRPAAVAPTTIPTSSPMKIMRQGQLMGRESSQKQKYPLFSLYQQAGTCYRLAIQGSKVGDQKQDPSKYVLEQKFPCGNMSNLKDDPTGLHFHTSDAAHDVSAAT